MKLRIVAGRGHEEHEEHTKFTKVAMLMSAAPKAPGR